MILTLTFDTGAFFGATIGDLRAAGVPENEILAAVKEAVLSQIDYLAEIARMKHITPGSGQAMTYQQKIQEVRAFDHDADPLPESYPLLAAEVGITAATLSEVAGVVRHSYKQWLQTGAAIEAVRLAAKRSASEALTVDDAISCADVCWPSP